MSRPDDAILRFERKIQAAVDRFAKGLRRHLVGEPPGETHSGSAGKPLDALLAEDARLRRRARRGAPCYDLNRHIAVRRLIMLVGGNPSTVA